jgi:uncharacterized protein YifE (UPF0438 family)
MSTPEMKKGSARSNASKNTRWKKGQSGNPKGPRGRNTKKVSKGIEEVFAKKVDIIENGIRRSGTVFEAILLQLSAKAAAGNTRAMRVWYKYEEFAENRPEYYVITADEARAGAEDYAKRLRGQA